MAVPLPDPRLPMNSLPRALLIAACLPLPAWAGTHCDAGGAAEKNPATFIVRSDNDVYGRANQDQNYTAGAAITWVSPRLDSYTEDPCLPGLLRGINRGLTWLQPRDADQRNLVLSFTESIYTPVDGTRSDLIVDDRPYAGVMMFGMGWNGRRGDTLGSTHLRLGMTGPSAQGEAAQNLVHRIFGRPRFQGWDNQLHDEVLLQLVHERLWRLHRNDYGDAMAWDVIGHAGGSLGNLATYANGGFEVRWGKHLPDDFGTDPFRPAGENTAPGERPDLGDNWGWHFFAGVDARYVFHDITLDGNTWEDSHSVDKREAVGDISLGVAITRGPWKIAGSHVRRTREFVGQNPRPIFGSVTVSREF